MALIGSIKPWGKSGSWMFSFGDEEVGNLEQKKFSKLDYGGSSAKAKAAALKYWKDPNLQQRLKDNSEKGKTAKVHGYSYDDWVKLPQKRRTYLIGTKFQQEQRKIKKEKGGFERDFTYKGKTYTIPTSFPKKEIPTLKKFIKSLAAWKTGGGNIESYMTLEGRKKGAEFDNKEGRIWRRLIKYANGQAPGIEAGDKGQFYKDFFDQLDVPKKELDQIKTFDFEGVQNYKQARITGLAAQKNIGNPLIRPLVDYLNKNPNATEAELAKAINASPKETMDAAVQAYRGALNKAILLGRKQKIGETQMKAFKNLETPVLNKVMKTIYGLYPNKVERGLRSTINEYLGDNPTLKKRALDKMNEFNRMSKVVRDTLELGGKGKGKAPFQWDHPISLAALERGQNIEGALRVNPIAGDVNQLKLSLDQKLNQFQNQIIKGKDIAGNRAKIATLQGINKKLFGELAPDYSLTQEGKFRVKDYGAQRFLDPEFNPLVEMERNLPLSRSIKKFADKGTNQAFMKNLNTILGEEGAQSFVKGMGQIKEVDETGIAKEIAKWAEANKHIPENKFAVDYLAKKLKGFSNRRFCGDGCFIDAANKDPNVLIKAFRALPKTGKIGAAITGLGAVGGGAYALLAGDEAKADTMKYNATTGQFDDAEGEPETQEGILNWIADNPIKSGLAPIPALLGASHFAPKAAARALTSFPALVAPALAAEKLYQYKQGVEPGDIALDPLNAIWAMGWGTSAADKWYRGIDPKTGLAKQMEKRLGLESLKPKNWRDTGKALKNVVMSPRATGTKMVFPFAGPKAGAGIGSTLLRGGARMLPLGPIPLALSAGYYGWNKYKDVRDTNSILDSMREQGNITEEDADTLRTIMKQGWLGTTSLGAKILGSEELELGGEMIGLDQQKQVLDRLRMDVDAFQEGDPEQGLEGRKGVRAKERQQEFFNWFSDGGRVGMKAGGMDRRTFLKWIAGLAATATGLIKGKGLTTKAPIAKAVPKAIAKFQGVDGMPLWFPRAVAKIKAHGKLLSMADKHYVDGDIYEMMIPVTRKYMDATKTKPGGENVYRTTTEYEKVTMEENPLTGEISMQWTGTDNFGDDAVRQINFKPGEAGYQKFGVDDPELAAQGMTEFQRVKVNEPEFTYTQPDQSNPYRDDIEYLDILTEGDEIVEGLSKMTQSKQMVTKDGTVIDVSPEGKGVDEAFQKKLYKDVEGEGQIIPEPENAGIDHQGNVYGEEQYSEIIGGEIPDHLKKKAEGGRVGMKFGGSWSDWMSNHSDDMTFEEYLQMDIDKPIHPINKNTGGIIETGEIARRPGAVPPLSGPAPDGIMSLYSHPKQVNVG